VKNTAPAVAAHSTTTCLPKRITAAKASLPVRWPEKSSGEFGFFLNFWLHLFFQEKRLEKETYLLSEVINSQPSTKPYPQTP
jgi:hypothetical protein